VELYLYSPYIHSWRRQGKLLFCYLLLFILSVKF